MPSRRLPPAPHSALRTRHSRSPGFTLAELVVSMAITSVLMLGVGSAILIASRAMPDAASPAGAMIGGSQVLEQIVTELQYATAVTGRSAAMIEFTVADRDGDAVDEAIRYEWSGSPGDPLTRQYNGGAVIEVLTDVREFALSCVLDAISTEIPQGNESAETILKSYSATKDRQDYGIKSAEWYGQYFFPVLPADAVSWKITRVHIFARTDGPSVGESRVQLHRPTAGKLPSGIVLEEKTLLESSLLAGYAEQSFAFSNVTDLPPDKGICVVVKWIYDAVACKVLGIDRNAGTPASFLIKSTDQGVSWSAPAGQSLMYTIYGTVTTAGQPQIQSTYYLDRVRISLRAGNDSQATVQSAVRLLNRPEVMQ